jgi:hypothetical protein
MYSNYARLYQNCNGSLAARTSSTRFILPNFKNYNMHSPTLNPNDEQRAGVTYLETSLPKDTDDSYRFTDLQENYQAPSASCSIDDSSSGTCGIDDSGKSICGNNKNLYPILDPRFNLRESAKHLILLEDHLFHEGKRCKDCILKHLLTIEGFLEEAITLDKKGEYIPQIQSGIKDFRSVFKQIADKVKNGDLTDEECCQLAQRLRVIRKPLCQNYATFIP